MIRGHGYLDIIYGAALRGHKIAIHTFALSSWSDYDSFTDFVKDFF